MNKEKLNLAPAEETLDESGEIDESFEKPDFVKKIEGFDMDNLMPENIEFMNHVIQDVFRDNFPIDNELIDKIPERMRFVSSDEFVRLRDGTEDSDIGFYHMGLDQILINHSKIRTPGALFSTMFHESLHFVSLSAGAGLSGGVDYPGTPERDSDDYLSDLTEGIRVLVEGTTDCITHAYVLDYLGFDPQPQMFGYEPEVQVANAILGPFSREERLQAYFNTPLELIRVRVEDAFEDDYNPDKPTGVFADCLVNIAKTNKRMREAFKSWNNDDNPEPIENILDEIDSAVNYFISRESKADS